MSELVDPEDAETTVDTLDADAVFTAPFERVGWDHSDAMIDEWGRQSFPASDPPSNW